MKKNYITIVAALLLGMTANSQSITSGLEDLSIPIDSFWNGNDLSGQFTSNSVIYNNYYDTAWGGSWAGVSYSSMRDTTTASFTNQYSCISGIGAGNSQTYGVVYPNSQFAIEIPSNGTFEGFYINNSTYGYLSMKNGDSFAKKFGDSTDANGNVDGTNGNDWFKLTIYGENNDSVEVFLADFRGSSSSIIKDWTYVSLSSLNVSTRKLKFKLNSTDIGSWGMNTPNYFCFDSLSYSVPLSLNENISSNVSIFPNPTNGISSIQFQDVKSGQYKLLDVSGREIQFKQFQFTRVLDIDLSNESKGVYFVNLIIDNKIITKKIIKQ